MTAKPDLSAQRRQRSNERSRRRLAVGPFCLLLAACGGMTAAPPTGAPAEVAAAAPQGPTRIEASPLAVQAGDFVSSGQILRIRGTITNRSAQDVRGVRYRVRFLSHADADARLLGREDVIRKKLSLAPGEQKLMRFDVQSIYVDIRGAGVQIDAWPITLGDREVLVPDDW